MKKGQVTFYILLAILVVLMVGIVAYLKEVYTSKQTEVTSTILDQQQLATLRQIVNACVQTTLEDAVRIIGLQGGYVVPPQLSLPTSFSTIAFWIYNGKDYAPSLKVIEDNIASYLETGVSLCANFDLLPGIIITFQKSTAKVTSDDAYITATVIPFLTVKKENQESTLKNPITKKIKVPLHKIYTAAHAIATNEMKKAGSIDISAVLNQPYEILILPHEDTTRIYSIIDKETKIGDTPYAFIFAYKE